MDGYLRDYKEMSLSKEPMTIEQMEAIDRKILDWMEHESVAKYQNKCRFYSDEAEMATDMIEKIRWGLVMEVNKDVSPFYLTSQRQD